MVLKRQTHKSIGRRWSNLLAQTLFLALVAQAVFQFEKQAFQMSI
jgi:hypothetical protein